MNYKQSKQEEKEAQRQRSEQEKEDSRARVTLDQLERIRQRNQRLTEEHTLLVRRKAEAERAQAERVQALMEAAPAPHVAPCCPLAP